MRGRLWCGVLCLLALTACVTKSLKQKLEPYAGQPASALFAKLGYPTGEQQIAGRKVYVWSTSHLDQGTTMNCNIRAIVDDRDVITNIDIMGNQGGCSVYLSDMSN